MQLKREKRENVEIFTGTMADVSFLLVIFFVVTTIFSVTKGLDYRPSTEEPVTVELQKAIDIEVLADGRLVVDGESLSLDALLPRLKEKLEIEPGKPVILRSDPQATYGQMIQVLDELRTAPEKAGFEIDTLAIPTFREMQSLWS